MMTVPTELETVGRLVLATVLGFVVGLEREAAGQSASERTHAFAQSPGGKYRAVIPLASAST